MLKQTYNERPCQKAFIYIYTDKNSHWDYPESYIRNNQRDIERFKTNHEPYLLV
jgi:hypothetical protein